MCGSVHIIVCPVAFIPVKKVQRIVTGAVLRLKQLFATVGFRAGPDNAVVIEIIVELKVNWFDILSPWVYMNER